MSSAFSIREALQGRLHDCAANAGFRCSHTEDLIRDFAASLTHYREEDVPLFPEVYMLSNSADLSTLAPSASSHVIGRVPIVNADAGKVLKNTATLAENGWSIYIVKTPEGNEFEYGVFRSQRHSIATSAEDSMYGLGPTSPIIVIRNRGLLTVEIVDSNKNRCTVSLTSSLPAPSPLAAHIQMFAESALTNVKSGYKAQMIPYLIGILTSHLQRGHGTLAAVIQKDVDAIPGDLADGVWLRPPVHLADCYVAAVGSQTAESLAELQAAESLLNGMFNSDGVVVFSNDGRILAFRVFLNPTPVERSKIPDKGGGRRRTFSLMQERVKSGSLLAAFFRSQDGSTDCKKAN